MDTRMHRRHLLGAAALAGPALAAASGQPGPGASAQEVGTESSFNGMNVIIFIIDQQRAVQHFPKGWEQEYL